MPTDNENISGEQLEFVVKNAGIDGSLIVRLAPGSTVGDLKRQISDDWPAGPHAMPSELRLIYAGRLLVNDAQALSPVFSGVRQCCFVHDADFSDGR